MNDKKVFQKRLKPLIFLYPGVIILAERFWSESFLRAKPRKTKLLGNAPKRAGRKEELL